MSPYLTAQRGLLKTTPGAPSKTDLRFFSPAQAHMAESAQFALAAMSTLWQAAMCPSFGTAQQMLPERTMDGLS
jgi:hypothetical protein